LAKFENRQKIRYNKFIFLGQKTIDAIGDGFLCPNRKYNFLKNRIKATTASAVAKSPVQAVFSLCLVVTGWGILISYIERRHRYGVSGQIR
jgi:hypothetical protein